MDTTTTTTNTTDNTHSTDPMGVRRYFNYLTPVTVTKYFFPVKNYEQYDRLTPSVAASRRLSVNRWDLSESSESMDFKLYPESER